MRYRSESSILFVAIALLPVELRVDVLGIQPAERIKRVVEGKGDIEIMQAWGIGKIVS